MFAFECLGLCWGDKLSQGIIIKHWFPYLTLQKLAAMSANSQDSDFSTLSKEKTVEWRKSHFDGMILGLQGLLSLKCCGAGSQG